MDRLSGPEGAGNNESRAGTEHSSSPPNRRVGVWHRTVDRNKADGISFAEKQIAVAGLAKARRIREDGLEHAL